MAAPLRFLQGSLLFAWLALAAPHSQAGALCNVQGRKANLNFTLKDIAGKDFSLSDYHGQVILLDFWATWCAPCRVEIPVLMELYSRYRERGLVVLGVSVSDSVSQLQPYVRELRMNYPVLVGAGRDDLQDAFGPLFGFPTSFLIGRDGAICLRHTGITSKQELEQSIQALL